MAKINEIEPTKTINLIGTGTTITGDIRSEGDIRIDGALKGNLHTQGKVVIGTTGNIEGEVHCKNIEISGKVGGKINVSELLSLKASARINGEIRTNKLAIEPGAVFSGTCDMKGNNIQSQHAEKGKEFIKK